MRNLAFNTAVQPMRSLCIIAMTTMTGTKTPGGRAVPATKTTKTA
jgi:hypothetical protein